MATRNLFLCYIFFISWKFPLYTLSYSEYKNTNIIKWSDSDRDKVLRTYYGRVFNFT